MVFVSFSDNFHLFHLNANHKLYRPCSHLFDCDIPWYLLICEYEVDSKNLVFLSCAKLSSYVSLEILPKKIMLVCGNWEQMIRNRGYLRKRGMGNSFHRMSKKENLSNKRNRRWSLREEIHYHQG